jgi:hypothetical protein
LYITSTFFNQRSAFDIREKKELRYKKPAYGRQAGKMN